MTGLWVKMLHNEREVQFPPCAVHHHHTSSSGGGASTSSSTSSSPPSSVGGASEGSDGLNAYSSAHGLHYPCPWGVVKEHYRTKVYEEHGIESCDAEDWSRICGGVAECNDEGDD